MARRRRKGASGLEARDKGTGREATHGKDTSDKTGKKKKAKEQYRTLLELDENSLEAQYRLGRLLFAQKRTRREGRALLDGLSRAFTQTIWSDKARGLLP